MGKYPRIFPLKIFLQKINRRDFIWCVDLFLGIKVRWIKTESLLLIETERWWVTGRWSLERETENEYEKEKQTGG